MVGSGYINGKTKLLGLIATPISHSLSPAMHNMACQELGLNYAYLAFDAGNQELEEIVKGFKAMDVRGFNVSMPNKTKILPLLDELAPAAKFAGAVNTVVNENGRLIGHLTDGTGYMRALKEAGVSIKGKKMTIFGAGGAATAIAIQAAMDGASEISIFNHKDEFFSRAERNAEIINDSLQHLSCLANVYDLGDEKRLKHEIMNSDLITNATGAGMKPMEQESIVKDTGWLRPEMTVSDIVYNPLKTKMLTMAEGAGCKTVNGLGMMLWQGAEAFEIWTGEKMPVALIRNRIFNQEGSMKA